ncbi:MAG: sulfatase [Planctomycetota bacterium]
MKNIVLLITDTYRYDNLGARARRPVRTPALDRFAAERAAEVHRMYAASFPTIPHRTDVATGRLGWPHYPWQDIRHSSRNHIASLLGQAGYVSQLLCDCPHLFNAGFQHGFQAAFQTRGQEGDTHLLHLNDPIQNVQPLEKVRRTDILGPRGLPDVHRWTNRYYTCEEETFAARTSRLAVRWLEENHRAEQPFFLWVDFFDPHEPWDPPEYLVKRYDPDYDGIPMIHPNYGRSNAFTPEELQNLWAHYAAEAELVDRMIGRILQKVDDTGLWDDTVVVVTSDHGFSIGEHARAGKGNISDDDDRFWPVYPEVGHVPFLVAGADVPAGAGLDLLAQPTDILPTLLDLAGVEAEPEEPFDGRSFAGALRKGAGTHRDLAVTGGCTGQATELPANATAPFVVGDRWGYAPVGATGRPELYDLAGDPLAETDVSDGNEAAVREMHEAFLQHLRDHNAPEPVLQLWTR